MEQEKYEEVEVKVSKTKMSRDKLDEFSHFFVTYINQIFGDRSVRAILYKLFGNQPHNKNLRFGLVAFPPLSRSI